MTSWRGSMAARPRSGRAVATAALAIGLAALLSCAVHTALPLFVPQVGSGSSFDAHSLERRGFQATSPPATTYASPGASTTQPTAAESSSFASIAVAGMCCALASFSAARCRSAKKQQRQLVVCQYFPSACGRKKQKVLRRLEPYGAIPAWSKKPLRRRRLIKPWRKHVTPRPSFYSRQQLEKQRIRFHYNVKEKQLQVYMRRALRKGVEYPIDNFLQQLESRLDNVVWRLGMARTMAAARRFVRQAHVQIKSGAAMKTWRTVNIPSIRLKVGDVFRIKRTNNSKRHAKYELNETGPVSIPPHLEWDPDKLQGEYLDVCDALDIGLDVREKYIALWYSGQRGLRRRHIRYFEGSERVIKKIYNGGRTRPTPENILNMKRGIGLQQRGRRRPPSLWGRRKPLNSPYYD